MNRATLFVLAIVIPLLCSFAYAIANPDSKFSFVMLTLLMVFADDIQVPR